MTVAVAPEAYVAEQLDQYATDYADTFAPECIQILDKAKRLVPLTLNRVQRAMGEIEREELTRHGNARIFALKGRQGGVTTDQQARAIHLIWSQPGAVAVTLADKREKTDKIFEITRRAIDNFPAALLPRAGGRETREISFPWLDSHFYTETAGSARAIAGLTVNRLHCSEFAFYDAPRTVLKVAAPSMVPWGSVIVLESTASDYGNEAHAFWQEAEKGANGYRAVFFPWWECDPTNYRLPLDAPDELGTLEGDERDLMAHAGLTAEQIKWRRAKVREMGRREFLQEYAEDAESCWMASGGLFYDVETLKALRLRAQGETPHTETMAGGVLTVYSELQEGERAIVGADTAEGGGGDASTFVARAFPSWRKLSTFTSAHVEPKEFAALLNTWGRRYRLALLVVEKNAHGITVLRALRDEHQYPTRAIYHRQTLDKDNAHDAVLGKIGWVTTAESKPLMLDAGREMFNAAIDGVADVPPLAAITDAFGVHRDKNNKVELNGRDMLVADMLAWIGRSMPVREVWVA